jgi:isoleucyl-tRNA synthetase
MKDEGLAREVINLVQKLRKEAHVTPSDAVTVYYEVRICTYSKVRLQS